MAMILKDKVDQLIVGHLTVINDNKTIGGILDLGSTDVPFGEPVAYLESGFYTAATAVTLSSQIAGIVQATNIKMPSAWPADGSGNVVKPNEAFNLLLRGWIAVKVAEAEFDNIKPGTQVKWDPATRLFGDTAGVELAGWTFTGIKEGEGTDTNPYRAEIAKKG